jgi:hypothetical protein
MQRQVITADLVLTGRIRLLEFAVAGSGCCIWIGHANTSNGSCPEYCRRNRRLAIRALYINVIQKRATLTHPPGTLPPPEKWQTTIFSMTWCNISATGGSACRP